MGKVISYDPSQNTTATLYYPSPHDTAYRQSQPPIVISQRPGKPSLNEDGHHDTVLNYLLENSRAMNEAGKLQTGFTDSGFEVKKEQGKCSLERAKNLDSQEERQALFRRPICPENVQFHEERVDHQIHLFLKSLAQYPRLIIDCCSLKYSFQDGYFLFKQYDQVGDPYEEIIDDKLLVETDSSGNTVPYYA